MQNSPLNADSLAAVDSSNGNEKPSRTAANSSTSAIAQQKEMEQANKAVAFFPAAAEKRFLSIESRIRHEKNADRKALLTKELAESLIVASQTALESILASNRSYPRAIEKKIMFAETWLRRASTLGVHQDPEAKLREGYLAITMALLDQATRSAVEGPAEVGALVDDACRFLRKAQASGPAPTVVSHLCETCRAAAECLVKYARESRCNTGRVVALQIAHKLAERAESLGAGQGFVHEFRSALHVAAKWPRHVRLPELPVTQWLPLRDALLPADFAAA